MEGPAATTNEGVRMQLTRTPAETLQNRLLEVAQDRSIVRLKDAVDGPEGQSCPRPSYLPFWGASRPPLLLNLSLDCVVLCIPHGGGAVNWID